MKNLIRLCTFALALTALPAFAQWDWSSTGSTGIVDDGTASLGLYQFTGPLFAVRNDSIAEVEARYPVTNTMGSSTDISPAWTTLQMAYADNSATAGSVVASLYEVDICSSTETLLCSITSNDGDGTIECSTCTFSGPLDFANKAYYVDVTVTKTDTPAAPGLYELAIY